MRKRPTRRDGRQSFSSSNALGIPDLIPAMCSDKIPSELVTYRAGRHQAEVSRGKVLSFFVDDYRFACAWNYPERMTQALRSSQWAAVCEPDFSVWADAPVAEQIHSVYRTRWCGRFWQESGVRLIPILNWSTPDSFLWSFSGIPYRCPVVAVECVSCGPNFAAFNAGLAAGVDLVRPSHLLIYGSRVGIQIPKGVEPHWYAAHSSTIKSRKTGATWAAEAGH
jgi:hypothetical protein